MDIESISTTLPWFFPAAVFIFGTMIGSFLNVVIYRVPAGKSVVFPGSHCGCGKPIAWYDNTPVISWFVLRGKARCCGQPYSFRYAFVELLTGAMFLMAWRSYPPMAALAIMIMLALLIAATFIDLDHMIIPDGITIWGTVGAVMISALIPQLHGYDPDPIYVLASIRSAGTAMIGAMIGSSLILWIGLIAEAILRKEAMGFGDVKFLGLIGAFAGWPGAIFAVFGGAIVGTIWFTLALLYGKITGGKSERILNAETAEGEKTDLGAGAQVPFGPMLAIAAVIYVLGGKSWMLPYVEQVLEIW
ncbi:MAG: A24 family peptidase [Synoicihabitans sp.]